jgi:hypothetical protein
MPYRLEERTFGTTAVVLGQLNDADRLALLAAKVRSIELNETLGWNGGSAFPLSDLDFNALVLLSSAEFDVESLVEAPRLERLHIGGNLRGRLDLSAFSALREFRFSIAAKKPTVDLTKLSSAKELRIVVGNLPERLLPEVSALPRLAYLELSRGSFESLSFLTGARALRYAGFSGCTRLTDIRALESLQTLEMLIFTMCRKIREFSDLSKLVGLRWLGINECRPLANLEFVRSLRKLEGLTLGGMIIEDGDLSPAKELPNLRYAVIAARRGYNVLPQDLPNDREWAEWYRRQCIQTALAQA